MGLGFPLQGQTVLSVLGEGNLRNPIVWLLSLLQNTDCSFRVVKKVTLDKNCLYFIFLTLVERQEENLYVPLSVMIVCYSSRLTPCLHQYLQYLKC